MFVYNGKGFSLVYRNTEEGVYKTRVSLMVGE